MVQPSDTALDALFDRFAALVGVDSPLEDDLAGIRAAVAAGVLTDLVPVDDLPAWLALAAGILAHAHTTPVARWDACFLAFALQRQAEHLLDAEDTPEAWSVRSSAGWTAANAFELIGDLGIAAEVWAWTADAADRAANAERAAAALSNLGGVLTALGRLDEAVAVLTEARARFGRLLPKRPDFEPALAGTLVNLGGALADQSRLREAAAVLVEARDRYHTLLPEHPDLEPDLARALGNLGLVLRLEGRLGEATAALSEARDRFSGLVVDGQPELEPDLARALTSLGNALQAEGRLGLAVVALADARDRLVALLPDRPDLEPELARAMTSLGNALAGQGHLGAAEAVMSEACNHFGSLVAGGQTEVEPDLARALTNLGLALHRLGRLDEATTALAEARDLLVALLPARPDLEYLLVRVLMNLGVVQRDQDLLGPAEAVLAEARGRFAALVTAGREDLEPDLAAVLTNLGLALDGLGRVTEATAALAEARDRYRAILPNRPDLEPEFAHTLGALGATLDEQSRLAEGMEARYEVRDRLRALLPERPDLASALSRALTNLGIALAEQGASAEAGEAYAEAMDTIASAGDGGDDARRYVLLNRARLLHTQARNAANSDRRVALLAEGAALASAAQEAAERLTGRTRALPDRVFQRDRLGDIPRLASVLALELDESATAFAQAQRAKGRTLADLLETRLADAPILRDDRLAAFDTVEWELLARRTYLHKAPETERAELPAVEQSLVRVRAERRVYVAGQVSVPSERGFLAFGTARPLASLATMLGQDEALLDLLDCPAEDRVAVFLLVLGRDERALVHHALLERSPLLAALDGWDAAREGALSDVGRAAAADGALWPWEPALGPGEDSAGPGLYRQLIAPLVPTLAKHGIVRLTVCPSGLTHRVPWAALWHQGADGTPRWSSEEITLSLSPTPTSLWYQRRLSAPRSSIPAVFAAAPFAPNEAVVEPRPHAGAAKRRDGRGLLPGTRWEVEQITALTGSAWPASSSVCLLGPAATRDEVLAALPLAILATLATHGSHDEAALDVGLYFRDPADASHPLSVEELYGDALTLHGVRVLALTACNLGRVAKKGDELLGFAQGFLHAGVAVVLAPLWAVDDGATAQLNVAFHRELCMAPSLTIAEAWRRAMAEVRAVPGWAHPAYWSAFLPMGDGTVALTV